MTRQNYTFGDNPTAAERLELLARVYEKTTRVLLVQALSFLDQRPREVIDVGSGPGATARLLAAVIQPDRVVGLDQAEAFVRLAARTSKSSNVPLSFFVHDAARMPYPTPPADLLYCRHLLTHLPQPGKAIGVFLSAIQDSGLVVLEENTSLRSADPVFARYYALVAAMQHHYGQDMRVGLRLAALAVEQGATSRLSRIIDTAVDPVSMAALHEMNLRTWKNDPFARAHFDEREIVELGKQLALVARGERSAPPVQVGIAQLVLGKR